MMQHGDHRDALISALAWQIELGADEAIGDAPLDRFAESEPRAPAQVAATIAPSRTAGEEPAPDAIRGRDGGDAPPRDTR